MAVRLETRQQILVITLDRPEKLNSLDREMYDQLVAAWRQFEEDDALRVAILTGQGERAFCVGRDLVQTATAAGDWSAGDDDPGSRVVPEACSKPVIAAVNGHCLAGGLALALACDLRLSAPHATYGTMAVKRGLIAGGGQIQRLVRYVPFAKAMELILLGEAIDAQEAWRIGLVNQIVPTADLLPRAFEWAEKLTMNSPLALKMSKQAAYRAGLQLSLSEGLRAEAELYARILQSEDAAEGLRAFAEKRPPRFPGR
jgi:enoyl-CoA hydratase/carnithine racemase